MRQAPWRYPLALLALLRHLRTDRTPILILVLVVALTSLLMAVAPRIYSQTLDDELAYRFEQAPVDQRNLEVTLRARLDPVNGAVSNIVAERGASYQAALSPAIQELITTQGQVTASPRFPIQRPAEAPAPLVTTTFQFRYQRDLDDQITYVDGRAPTAQASVALDQLVPEGLSDGFEDPPGQIPLFETALSTTTASELDLMVGDLLLMPFTTESQSQSVAGVIQVVGLFTVNDIEHPSWYGDHSLAEPELAFLGSTINAAGLFAPDAYPDLFGLTESPWEYRWRYFFDGDRLTADNYQTISREIIQLQLTGDSTDIFSGNPNLVTLRTRLPRIFESFEQQAQLAVSIGGLAMVSLLVTALLAVGVLAVMIAGRRRDQIALLRSRGAATGQLLGAQLLEGLLLYGPAVIIGYLGALWLVESRPTSWSIWLSALTLVLAILVVLLAAQIDIRAPLRRLLGGLARYASATTSVRRLAVELLLILLAVAGTLALRQRGLQPAGDGDTAEAVNPFLMAVPVLLALVAAIVSLRLYPLLMQLVARGSRRGRAVVSFMSFRWAASQSAATLLPLPTILLAVGLATFTGIIASSVDAAQQETAWNQVGAAYRIEGTSAGRVTSLPDSLDLTAVPGVSGVTEAVRAPESLITPPEGAFITTRELEDLQFGAAFLAVDLENYADLTTGTLAAADLPPALMDPPAGAQVGSTQAPIPAIVSSTWPERAQPQPEPGAIFGAELQTLQAGTLQLNFEVAAIRNSFPGLPDDAPFIVAPLASIQAAAAGGAIRPTTLYVGGSASQSELEAAIQTQAFSPELREILPGATANVEVLSRQDAYEQLSAAPLAQAVLTVFRAGVVVAGLYAVLAMVTGVVITTRSRARDLGYLRTLGLSPRQATMIIALEQLPVVLVANGVGVVLGLAIALAIDPGLDLSAFTGQQFAVPLQVDWLTIGMVTGLLAATMLIVLGIVSVVGRKKLSGDVTRI